MTDIENRKFAVELAIKHMANMGYKVMPAAREILDFLNEARTDAPNIQSSSAPPIGFEPLASSTRDEASINEALSGHNDSGEINNEPVSLEAIQGLLAPLLKKMEGKYELLHGDDVLKSFDPYGGRGHL